MRDDSVYLIHILDAVDQIFEYIKGLSEEEFLAKRLVQDGVIRQIEIIGEATKQLSTELRENNSDVPWRDMARMRDKLIHQYFGVDHETVWLTATEDLPVLRNAVEQILDGLSTRKRS